MAGELENFKRVINTQIYRKQNSTQRNKTLHSRERFGDVEVSFFNLRTPQSVPPKV